MNLDDLIPTASELHVPAQPWWQCYRRLGAIDAYRATTTSPLIVVMPWGTITSHGRLWHLCFVTARGKLHVGPFISFREARAWGLAWHRLQAVPDAHRALDPRYRRGAQ